MKIIRLASWLAIVMAIAACGNSGTNGKATAARESDVEPPVAEALAIETIEIMPGLSMRRLREGTGQTAEVGHTVVVHYTGWLYDESAENNRGKKFDSSVDRGVHFEFPLGARRVIRG